MPRGTFGHPLLDALLANLVSAWKLNEAAGNTRVDGRGGNNLTEAESIPTAAGKEHLACDFSGAASSSLSKSSFSGWPAAGHAYSLSLWLNFDAGSGDDGVWSADAGGTAYLALFIENSTNKLKHYFYDGSVVKSIYSGVLSTGTWYHVVCVYDGTKMRIWVDGAESGTGTAATTNLTPNVFYLGRRGTGYCNGRVDEAYFWNVALTDAQIKLLYNGGAGRFWVPYGAQARGRHLERNAYVAEARGRHKCRYVTCSLEARGRHLARNAYVAEARGRHAVTVAYTADARGLHARIEPWGGAARGRYLARNNYLAAGRGRHAACTAYLAEFQGLHRVANGALARYELYRGIDAAPDFTAAPWETFTTLPHVTAALDAAPEGTERTYHLVLRARNAYDLASRNVAEWTVTVDDAGAEVTTRPSAPEDVAVEAAAAGAVLVTARYMALEDGADAATRWLVYLRSNGTNPDPAVDTPTVVTMVKADGNARLSWTSGVCADGAAVRVIVRVRRVDTIDPGPPPVTANIDSTNVDVHSATADTDGPAAVTPAGVFFGTLHEQGQ